MFIVILTILFSVYTLYFLLRKKNREISEKGTGRLRLIHLVLLSFLLILWDLATKEIFIRGFWTTKILIWVYIISGIILFAFGDKNLQKKVERIYYGLFFYLPFLLVAILFIPFLGMAVVISLYGFTIGDKKDILYSDRNYRLQQT